MGDTSSKEYETSFILKIVTRIVRILMNIAIYNKNNIESAILEADTDKLNPKSNRVGDNKNKNINIDDAIYVIFVVN